MSVLHSVDSAFDDAHECAQVILRRVGTHLRVALPLGLGKANHVVNALYEIAVARPEVKLELYTALSLAPPRPAPGLAGRFVAPFVARQYADYPELHYERDRRASTLPENVTVVEFFLQSGSHLSNPEAQQNYVSSNYTHALRDLCSRDINVLLQMVAVDSAVGQASLSCNPDLSLALLHRLAAERAAGRVVCTVAEVNPQLPYLAGSAEVPLKSFDVILDNPSLPAGLFAVPNEPVSLEAYAIAAHAASLVPDDGTLQIGIGSLGDALAYLLGLRHTQSTTFKTLIASLTSNGATDALHPRLARTTGPFERGLYGLSEMLVQGLLHLRRCGVLTREVPDPDAGERRIYLHAGFYLGSRRFYQELASLSEADGAGMDMTCIDFINDLYGDEAAKRSARQHARFVNSAMMVTLSGSAVSDTLEDGRVVSGVGGQYNFMAMAHELDGARGILALQSTRRDAGRLRSNIVYKYGQCTIPRHLRDVVVTEYGVADLRGQTDAVVAARLVCISDSRFQPELLASAKRNGKLPHDYEIPEPHRRNLPQALHARFSAKLRGVLPRYPLGTDYDDDEAALVPALHHLKAIGNHRRSLAGLIWSGLRTTHGSGPRARSFDGPMARMELTRPSGWRERLWRYLLLGALQTTETGQPQYTRGAPHD